MTTSPSRSTALETLTLLGRLRGAPGMSFFALCVLAALAVATWQFQFIRAEFNVAEVGLTSAPTTSGHARLGASPLWPGLQQGDALLAIDGVEVDFEGWRAVRRTLEPGPHVLKVERGDAVVEVPGEVQPQRLAYTASLIVRFVTGLVLFCFGLGAFLLRPRGATSWLFLLLMLGVGTATMLTAGASGFVPGVYQVVVCVLAAVPSVGLHLFLLFPERPRGTERWNRRLLLLHLPGLLLIGLLLSRWLVSSIAVSIEGGSTITLEFGARLWSILSLLGIAAVLLVQWRRFAREGNGRIAAQYRLLWGGLAVGLLAPSVIVALARAFDGNMAIAQASVSLVLCFAVALGVVLVRNNPLELDRYAASVIGYLLALGALGLAFGLGLVALPLAVTRLGLASSSEALVALTALITWSVGPVYRRVRRRVARWFSAEQADALQTAALLQKVMSAAQQRPRSEAQEEVFAAAMALGAEYVSLWELEASGRHLLCTGGRGPVPPAEPLPRASPFAEALERTGGVNGLCAVRASPALQEALWAQGLAMAAPVRVHSVAMGVLGVGRRASGFEYRAEELTFLETLASQLGLILERGQTVTQIGRYRIERRLASGGMAEIFVAWQLGLGGFERKVALKRLLPEYAEDPGFAAGLLDEARVTARLQHRNIAQTYEVGLEGGQHFIAMEFVDGPPLRALLAAMARRGERVALEVAVAIAAGLLSALHHAHQLVDAQGQLMGIVHRDVTPANLLVSVQGEAKLVDFGLVMANTRLFRTQTGVARGTLPFMSPEQSFGQSVDRRSDIYSAGATLFELFTGTRAFPEGPRHHAPPSACAARPQLPPALDPLFVRAMAWEPADRFATAEDFREALLVAAGVAPAPEPVVAAWVQRLHHAAAAELPRAPPETATRTSRLGGKGP